MNDAVPVLTLLAGIGLGAVAAWLLLRAKIRHAFDRGGSEAGAEMAALSERLSGRDETIEQLRGRADGPTRSASELSGAYAEAIDYDLIKTLASGQ